MKTKLWSMIAVCISLGSLTACNENNANDGTVESIAESQLRVKPIGTPGKGNQNKDKADKDSPAVDEPVVDVPVVDEPVVDEPVVDEPVIDVPVVDEPVIDVPVVDEPVIDVPAVDEPVVDVPVIDVPVVDEPAVDEPVVDEPAVDEPVIDEPVVDEPVVDEPVVDEPVVDEPVVAEPGVLLPPYQALPLYSGDSIWNQSIPSQPEIDANSPAMVKALVTAARSGYDPTLNVKQWSVPVYVADAATPRYNVQITGSNTQYGFQAIIDVPIPDGAKPDPAADGHMVIIDTTTGTEYDFWQAKQNADGSWGASWGNRIALDSDGIFPTGSGAKASGFAAMAGIIWPEEFKQGRIDHALFMALPIAASGGFVAPATSSDGWISTVGAIPEGAHLQLDPNLDLNQFTMTAYERIIAEALQTYGAYVGDYSGAVSLYAINPQSYPENPYPAGWFDNTWNNLKGIPWEHMRVLKMGTQGWGPTGVADFSIYQMAY